MGVGQAAESQETSHSNDREPCYIFSMFVNLFVALIVCIDPIHFV